MKENSIVKQPLPHFVVDDSELKVYPSNKMTIFKSMRATHVLKGEHVHTNYEFVIARSNIEGFMLGNKKIDFKPDQMVVVYSGQNHGTQLLMTDIEFVNIQFEREFLHEVMYAVYRSKEMVITQDVVSVDETLKDLIEQYILEFEQQHSGYLLVLEQLCITIAVKLLRLLVTPAPVMSTEVETIIEYMKAHLESEFSLDEISSEHNMSKSCLIRKFKEKTGITPYDYFLELKISKALRLLNDPNNKVIDVALQCGFSNHSHFSKTFKRATGMTPTAYREKILFIKK